MTQRDPALEPFAALIGTWTTEATHPEFDGAVPGNVTYSWLEGERYVVQRSRNEHELFPDAVCVIGPPEDGDRLAMEYFDSRGVRRTYGIALEDGVLRTWRDAPGFAQRFEATLGPDGFEGLWQLARTPGDWRDDLRVTYRRAGGRLSPDLMLFAGVPVRDFAAARAWYERLLGEVTFMPHGREAVWDLAAGRSVYIVEDADRAGRAVLTVFLDDLDAALADVASRGLEPERRETYANGVRKATFVDPDGNEVGFGGMPVAG